MSLLKKYLFVLILILPVISLGMNITSSKITLKSAVEIAKTYFDVPASFTNFSFNYNTYDDHQDWNLSWSMPQIDGESGSINVTINASTGDIESMNYWSQSKNQPKYLIPKISRNKARKIAENFLKNIDANKISDIIHLNNSDQIVPLTLPQSYVFEWERVVNGIPFSNDEIQISVDAQSGRVTNYQMNWTDAKFPSPLDVLDLQQAKSAFLSDNLLTLEYYPPQSTDGSTAILVYALPQKTNGAIDAITGKPIDIQNSQWLNWGYFSNVVNGVKAIDSGNQIQLEENYKFISPKSTITENESQNIAQDFLKKVQSAYFTQSKWNPHAGYKPQGAYNFVYDRIVDGIPFPANSMEITVSDFGMVTSYTSNWSDLSFESTDDIIPLNAAKMIFLNYRPLVLNYVKINDNSTSTIKLVYLPETRNLVSNFLNAKTGEPMNWNGKPLAQVKANHFADISSTEYATSISYLDQAGLFRKYGNLFMPYGKITVLDFIKNLLGLQNGSYYADSLSPQQIMNIAKYDDLVPLTVKPEDLLDKATLSEIMMRFLGLKVIAKAYGYQALAEKLGIVSTSSSSVTRLEAAISIIKAIELY